MPDSFSPPVASPALAAPIEPRPARSTQRVSAILPGLVLTGTIAAAAQALHTAPLLSAFSPMILAIALGMVFHNLVGTPATAKAGVVFALRKILRLAIILLGLQLTAQQVAEVGARGVAVIALTLVATFAMTVWLGRLLGVERKLAELIAAGTSICGASAVIATNAVTEAPDEDVAYAVACVTIFGSIAMFAYPLLSAGLGLSARTYGLWSGASIHEIAQVVAAAYQRGSEAGDFGVIAKLSRVTLLAPVVIALSFLSRLRKTGARQGTRNAPMPWFVLGFIALVVVNSVVAMPAPVKAQIVTATTMLLSMALAAMGLETDMRKLRAKGLKPLLLGAASFLFIAGFSLMLVEITT